MWLSHLQSHFGISRRLSCHLAVPFINNYKFHYFLMHSAINPRGSHNASFLPQHFITKAELCCHLDYQSYRSYHVYCLVCHHYCHCHLVHSIYIQSMHYFLAAFLLYLTSFFITCLFSHILLNTCHNHHTFGMRYITLARLVLTQSYTHIHTHSTLDTNLSGQSLLQLRLQLISNVGIMQATN